MMKLERVRQHLALIRMVQTEPATVQALTEAIEDLDDLLVAEVRAERYAKDNPPMAFDTFSQKLDIAEFAKDMVLSMNRMAVISR
jgi:lactam utilization protein B